MSLRLFLRLTLAIFILSSTCLYAQIPKSVKNTIWIQQGYGRVLEIEDSTYLYSNYNKYQCSEFVQGRFDGRFKIIKNDENQLTLNPGGIVDYRFEKTNKFPKNCLEKRSENDNSFELNFKSFWYTFNSNYAFFKERELDWQQVYYNYLPKVRKVKTNLEFALILQEVIEKFNDGHIKMEIPDSIFKNHSNPRPEESPISKDQILSHIETKYLKESSSYNNGVIRWGILKNSNIGYIGITDMNDFAHYIPDQFQNTNKFDSIYNLKKSSVEPLELFQDEIKGVNWIMKRVLRDLNRADPIILDLRFNSGGYETVALELLSYFVSEEKEVISIKVKTKHGFTPVQKISLTPQINKSKKIYLLLSPATASAAEVFALASLSYSNIKIIGSRSSGIFSEILWKQLPNGWKYSLSNEVYMSYKNKTYEGKGIPVDFELDYPTERSDFYKSFFSNNRFFDLAIEKVISLN
jgi:hypothetical protein